MLKSKLFDGDSIWVMVFQFANILKGPFILIPVALFLSLEDQGYWFAFVSVGAAIVLADLGFTTLLTQFTAFEFSRATISSMEDIEYSPSSFSFLAVSSVFYVAILFVFFIATLAVGTVYVFEDVENKWPWVVYCIAGIFNLLFLFLSSIINGLGFVKISYRMRAILSLMIGLLTLFFLLIGQKLWALSLGLFVPSLLSFLYLVWRYKAFWLLCAKAGISNWSLGAKKVNELMRVQLRFVITWICGYVIFQLPVPLTLKYIGAVDAGKLGMAMTVSMALANFSGAYVTSRLPKISKCFGLGDINGGISIFTDGFKLRCMTHLALIGVFAIAYYFVVDLDFVKDRFLPLNSLVFMSLIYVLYGFFTSWANLTRANKEESFVFHAIFNSFFILIAYYYGVYLKEDLSLAIAIQFFMYVVFLFPWAYIIYYRKVKEYKQKGCQLFAG